MRVTDSRLTMGNGLSLTFDGAGKTAGGLSVVDEADNVQPIEAAAVVARGGVFDRDDTEGGAWLDCDATDVVVGGGVYLPDAGTATGSRKSAAPRLRGAGGALVVDTPGRPGALTVNDAGVHMGSATNAAFVVYEPGAVVYDFPYEWRVFLDRGCEGPAYRQLSWCHLHRFHCRLFWDHKAGSDPAIAFTATPSMANGDHWQMQTHALQFALDGPETFRIFGGPSNVNHSWSIAPGALPTGQVHEWTCCYDATTGNACCEIYAAGDMVTPVLDIEVQVGAWPLFQALYVIVCNDDDSTGGSDMGLRWMTVRSAVAHAVARYTMLFEPTGGQDLLTELVPGKGGAQLVQEAFSAGTGLVSQAPTAADYATWNAWADAQVSLSCDAGQGATAFPVVDAQEGTRVDAAGTVVDAPFWVRFTPTTTGGTGMMSGSPWNDDKYLASSAVARVVQHAFEDAPSYEYAVSNGLRLLVLVQVNANGLDANDFASVDRNGYVSSAKQNGTAGYAYAVWSFSDDGTAHIIYCRTFDHGGSIGTRVPGDHDITSVV